MLNFRKKLPSSNKQITV